MSLASIRDAALSAAIITTPDEDVTMDDGFGDATPKRTPPIAITPRPPSPRAAIRPATWPPGAAFQMPALSNYTEALFENLEYALALPDKRVEELCVLAKEIDILPLRDQIPAFQRFTDAALKLPGDGAQKLLEQLAKHLTAASDSNPAEPAFSPATCGAAFAILIEAGQSLSPTANAQWLPELAACLPNLSGRQQPVQFALLAQIATGKGDLALAPTPALPTALAKIIPKLDESHRDQAFNTLRRVVREAGIRPDSAYIRAMGAAPRAMQHRESFERTGLFS